MPGPQNVIMGDEDYGTQIPETQAADEYIDEEKRAAKFSRTAEFKKLEANMDARIAFYQAYLPDGTPVAASKLSDEELGKRWREATTIIAELNNVKSRYASAQDTVRNVGS